jgi:hypothetical protein
MLNVDLIVDMQPVHPRTSVFWGSCCVWWGREQRTNSRCGIVAGVLAGVEEVWVVVSIGFNAALKSGLGAMHCFVICFDVLSVMLKKWELEEESKGIYL